MGTLTGVPATDHNALCLRVWEYSETSQTACLLTRELGLLRVIAKGSRRDRSPFSGGLELVTRGVASVIVKDTGAMSTLTEWDLRETYRGVRGSLAAFGAAMYSADLLLRLIGEGDPHPRLFDAVGACWASFAEHDTDLGLVRFHCALLTETGSMPRLEPPGDDTDVVYFSPESGSWSPDQAEDADAWPVRGSTLRLISRVRESGFDADGAPGPECAVHAGRANRFFAAYVRHVLGREPEAMSALFGENPVPDARTQRR